MKTIGSRALRILQAKLDALNKEAAGLAKTIQQNSEEMGA